MNIEHLRQLIRQIQQGEILEDAALEALKNLPFEDIGLATIDHHRELRKGFPEVILGEWKTSEQIAKIIERMRFLGQTVLVTRLSQEKADFLLKFFGNSAGGEYNALARTLVFRQDKIPFTGKGTILIVSAGTSDIPVAEEAFITAELMGNRAERMYDVGVAGVHRLLNQKERLSSANVIIVVAGMEGALPSIVGGLVSRPVIAVPTSVGYGASFHGLAALLGMLNSCASGVAVVNIDNGFGAAYIASLINH